MKKTYIVEGMHCKACELLVRQGCKKIAGCTVSHISHRTGKITVHRRDRENKKAFDKMISSLGYTMSETGNKKKPLYHSLSAIERMALVLLAIVGTFVLIEVDVMGLVADVQQGTGWGMVFVLGLVASVSTCLAVTGGGVLGFTELVDESRGRWGHMKIHGSFQVGRILGFFLGGALLALLGQQISIGLGFTSWMNAFIALIFIYLGLQLLGFVPSLSSLGFHMPDKRTSKILSSRNPYLAPIVGALTFFLPCGFTQSVQLMALASGSWRAGGAMMAIFALGTTPGLLALGMGSSWAKDHRKQGFEYIVAVLLLIFGLFTFRGSARIWGWTDTLSSLKTGGTDTREINGSGRSVEKIRLGHDGLELIPVSTTLSAGKDYEITIVPERDGMGCMSTVLLPRIDNTPRRVQAGVPLVYTLKNPAPGKYTFVCGAMGMRQGEIIVQ